MVNNIIESILGCCGDIRDIADIGNGKNEDQSSPIKTPTEKTSSNLTTAKSRKYMDVLWSELPSDAQNAVSALGYEQETWDEGGWIEINEYGWRDLQGNQLKAATTLGWDQDSWNNRYNDVNFKDLPPAALDAATFLGFTAEIWNEGQWPDSVDKWWCDMTSDEKKAMNVLGYHEQAWNSA